MPVEKILLSASRRMLIIQQLDQHFKLKTSCVSLTTFPSMLEKVAVVLLVGFSQPFASIQTLREPGNVFATKEGLRKGG